MRCSVVNRDIPTFIITAYNNVRQTAFDSGKALSCELAGWGIVHGNDSLYTLRLRVVDSDAVISSFRFLIRINLCNEIISINSLTRSELSKVLNQGMEFKARSLAR